MVFTTLALLIWLAVAHSIVAPWWIWLMWFGGLIGRILFVVGVSNK